MSTEEVKTWEKTRRAETNFPKQEVESQRAGARSHRGWGSAGRWLDLGEGGVCVNGSNVNKKEKKMLTLIRFSLSY